MDSYSATRLLTGRELSRSRQRGLSLSKPHQQQVQRNADNLLKLFKKFDLNGDGELTTNEFVCALRTMNPQLSDHAIRQAAHQIDSDELFLLQIGRVPDADPDQVARIALFSIH